MQPIRNLRWTVATLLVCLVGHHPRAAAAEGEGQEGQTTPPRAVQTQNIRFSNGDTPLAGVVLAPVAREPVPAVALIHGSGTSDRTQAWASAFARGLVERGIAVLLPDKRGSGASGGDWKTASFEVLADDAIAAVEALQAVDGVDGRRIGVLGLSQGGHIAPLAARRSEAIAFVVDVSGSAVPITEQVIDEVETLARRQGFTRNQVERVNALHRLAIRYGLTGEGWEEYDAALAAASPPGSGSLRLPGEDALNVGNCLGAVPESLPSGPAPRYGGSPALRGAVDPDRPRPLLPQPEDHAASRPHRLRPPGQGLRWSAAVRGALLHPPRG